MEDQGLRCEEWTVALVQGCIKIKKNEDSNSLHSEPNLRSRSLRAHLVEWCQKSWKTSGKVGEWMVSEWSKSIDREKLQETMGKRNN